MRVIRNPPSQEAFGVLEKRPVSEFVPGEKLKELYNAGKGRPASGFRTMCLSAPELAVSGDCDGANRLFFPAFTPKKDGIYLFFRRKAVLLQADYYRFTDKSFIHSKLVSLSEETDLW